MPRIAALFALIFAIASNARAGNVIHVADGDCAALNAAVSLAPAGEQTTVVLARNGTYNTTNTQAVDYCGLWVHAGNVVVEGQGSVLSSQVCGSGLTIVDAGAQLTLRDANALGQDCGLGNTIITDVSNDGDLSFENVSLRIVSAKNYQNASMTLRNVTVSSPVGIVNSGSLNVFNSTLFTNIGTNPGSHMVLANSALPAAHGFCSFYAAPGTVQSLGGNVVGSGCAWAVVTDVRSTDATAGLGPLQDNGGLGVLTAVPTSSSIVRGVGLAKYCEATDARGVLREAGACDAGAAQFDATKSVGEGGMNGVWYDRAANGHYVTIQRVHDDDTALVIWDTFDRNGNQAWIYGVGHVSGKHISIQMSQNLGGRLQAGGPPTGSSVHPWGTVEIDLASCTSGTLRYQSSIPTFGSGQFPLDRLAYVSAFGCVD